MKEVTIASESVFGSDRRDGFVRARFEHQNKTRRLLKLKKDHAQIVKI